MAVEQAVYTSEEKWPCVFRDLFLRVLKLAKQPHMKYGKGTNKGMLKVRYCQVKVRLHTVGAKKKFPYITYVRYVISTIKVRLHSTELVRSCKAYIHRGSTVLSAYFQRTLIRTFTVLHTWSLR